MKKAVIAGLCLLVVAVGCSKQGKDEVGAESEERGTSVELKKVEETFVEGMNREDIDMVMSAIHSTASDLNMMLDRQNILSQFKHSDYKFTLLSFQLIGTDDDMAVARVKHDIIGTPKGAEKPFHTRMDALRIFKREAGKWKMWTVTPLELRESE